MTPAPRMRGAMPVGYLSELDAVEAKAVQCLRLWCDGPESRAELWNEFARTIDTPPGRRALKSFESLLELWLGHARRPLMRHQVGCRCIGGDEACFAIFVAAAGSGDREDAMMIATTLVRADIAAMMVSLAEDFGLALRRMAVSHAHTAPPRAPQTTLH